MAKMGAFRFWCQKVLPLVYDDSISYYELLNKMVVYLNNVISDFNTVAENFDNLDDAFDTLQGSFNDTKNAMLHAYDQLQSYVNNYFDNLDVQEEINNKLDEMAEDGSLSELLKPFITTQISADVAAWLQEHITPTSPAVDSSLTVSGAAADAKVTGDKIGDLKDDLSDIVTIPNNVNLFDKANLDAYTIGEAINTNTGSTEAYANMCTTDYIRVDKDVQYSFLGAVAYYGASNVRKIPVYKEDHTFLAWCWGTLDSSTNVVTFTLTNSIITTETGVIRLSFRKADIDSFMFVEGEYPSEYVPYEHPTLNPNIEITGIKSLKGKSIALNGDSICAGGGDAVGGYGLIISENENMVYQNIAVAGGTITYISGRHCISRTMGNMNHSDYVIFEGGINDKALDVPFGSISEGFTAELDDTTFCGAFEKCCKTLCESYSTSKYGYVFVHRIALASDWYSQYRPAMKDILNKWGIPYIDLQELVPPLNFIDSLKTEYTNDGDGWHPNKLGYKTFYVSKITEWLKTL